jgi:predicted esterase
MAALLLEVNQYPYISMKQITKQTVLVVVATLLFSFNVFSQTLPSERQFKRPKNLPTKLFGHLEYQPENYATAPDKSLPLVFFFHGTGQGGDGKEVDLAKLYQQGLPKYINENKPGFSNFPFILISPQLKITYKFDSLGYIFDEILKLYPKADPNRIYVTGLSYGGGATFVLGWTKPTRITALLPTASMAVGTSSAPRLVGLPIWAFHNLIDPTVDVTGTTKIINAIIASGGTPDMTIYDASGHNCWDKTYTTQDAWDWLLSQKKNNKTPLANAGPDKEIKLPTNTVVLNGSASDTDGTIASYSWSKASGPSCLLEGSATQNLTVKNLVVGKYVFRLKAKDNGNTIDIDEVVVNVLNNTAPVVNAGKDNSTSVPSSLSITGTATDEDGIKSYLWTKVSGPAVTLSGENTATLSLSGFASAGTYTFRLTAEDNFGAKASDDVVVYVSQLIEAETGVLTDTIPTGSGNAGIKNVSIHHGGQSVMISSKDKLSLVTSVQPGQYYVYARVRSGAYTVDKTKTPWEYPYDKPKSYWDNGRYKFNIETNSITARITFIGLDNTISPKDESYGYSYWGTMKSAIVTLNETSKFTIKDTVANYGGIDYIEIVPVNDPSAMRAPEQITKNSDESSETGTTVGSVYPNPFGNSLTIPLNVNERRSRNLNWAIVDMIGRTITKSEVVVEEQQSDLTIKHLDNILNGNYVITIKSETSNRAIRIRKE